MAISTHSYIGHMHIHAHTRAHAHIYIDTAFGLSYRGLNLLSHLVAVTMSDLLTSLDFDFFLYKMRIVTVTQPRKRLGEQVIMLS